MDESGMSPDDAPPAIGDAVRLELLAAVVGRLRIIVREINRHSVRTEKLIGIKTTELLFLQLICRRPGIRLSEIAHGLSVHQSTSSNVKRSLVEQGLVDEIPNTEDRRVSFLHPTEEGVRRVVTAVKGLSSPLRTATESIDIDDLKTLDRLLGSITDRIDQIYANGEEDLA
jgi:DNA-binding MarR family transcriptional regulator